ncbi:AKAP7 2'5' RNA ligase-like domain-containing protein [Flagelloscypha sp. PMI_526]|nr:AKAP7 2'5' RNA ligase-like domain-containing protein [Flagelloscypha sp. PMI_526]
MAEFSVPDRHRPRQDPRGRRQVGISTFPHPAASSSSSHNTPQTKRTPKASQASRPTHFLSIPLGTYSDLNQKLSSFNDQLQQADPPVTGLDETILIRPRRVHFTLGVMSLASRTAARKASKPSSSQQHEAPDPAVSTPIKPTVDDALAVLKTLEPSIRQAMGSSGFPAINLNTLNVLKSTFNKESGQTTAHVLYAAPKHGTDDYSKLFSLCNLIRNGFKDAGFITETRDLTLHLTLINTSHRKSVVPPQISSNDQSSTTSPKKERRGRFSKPIPFSYSDILQSASCMNVLGGEPITSPKVSRMGEIPIDLGTYTAQCVQLCIMGSYGGEGEYVSVGEISLQQG